MDGELSAAEANELDQHLATCAMCQKRMTAITQEVTRTQQDLGLLAPSPNESPSDVQVAYQRLQARTRTEIAARPNLVGRLLSPGWRPAWGAVAVACAVMAILSFSAGRGWAQRVLAMLRVQKITVVPVDFSNAPVGSREQEAKLVGQMISDEVVTLKEPGKPKSVADAKTAAIKAGFGVRSATNFGAPQQIVVRGEAAFQMTLNRDRIAAILQEVGRSDIELPNTINGATVSVHIPSSVLQLYGDCKNEVAAIERMEQNHGTPENREGPRGFVSNDNCIAFGQVPSPTVTAPPNVNFADLAQAGLQLAGMSAGEARSFTQTIDWSSTLVIPVPRNITSYQNVPVDGVEGTLVETDGRNGASPRYGLFWVKNGIIYSIHGRGSADQALLLASSLR
ncbi:MAG TPA: zf-HC2 domain-containing protein [Terriglobales bacterium]|nr:zf-HC2 domain-containing protein [Terriglobales bacterium]